MPTIAEWNELVPSSKSVLRARAVRARYGFPMITCLFVCGVATLRAKGKDESKVATLTAAQDEAVEWVVGEMKGGR